MNKSEFKLDHGNLIISLDFELHWGIFGKYREGYEPLFISTRNAILKILDLFDRCGIHATWATVGMLFPRTRQELMNIVPMIKPTYDKSHLSSYNIFDQVGSSEDTDISHFANSIINKISVTPGQEIGSHTFSHYFACEKGQTLDAFKNDIFAAIKIGNQYGLPIRSLVFPRNQINYSYLPFLKAANIQTVRSNPEIWFYNASQTSGTYNSFIYRFFRALDLVLPVANTLFSRIKIPDTLPLCIPASRFLRPYKKRDLFFNKLKLMRIQNEMTLSAKRRLNYHLWWHPHNFGHELDENINYLEKILIHFKSLQAKHNYESLNMTEFYEYCKLHAS